MWFLSIVANQMPQLVILNHDGNKWNLIIFRMKSNVDSNPFGSPQPSQNNPKTPNFEFSMWFLSIVGNQINSD